ncbi:hypothetical protein SAM9427_36880 (plasmid) [Streptomyces sp. ETH9427]|uniref:hypothetical protein n=1 Tax=Streptomyces sp. E1N211 TaxID=1851876 RepID=UPI000E0B030A|nr:hypothetical protein [Streptomyces sp. E1N211]AXI91344.1 hypothetical protein SAM9427_36880 [Streptomyces sp. ETH9427]
MVLAAVVAGVSGCGGGSEKSEAAKPSAPAAPSLSAATTAFQDAVADHGSGGCPSTEPGTCWEEMQALIKPARTLRKAMNAHKDTGPEFWSEAYVFIDKMEKGVAVGEDRGGGLNNVTSNRPDVFGSAHDLSRWLDAHPVA